MANQDRLGASFSIDTTALKAGLAQANRLIRESESEFKAAAAGMDKWATSQAGLEARIKYLNTAQDLQAKKVEALKKQYQEAGYASDDLSAAAVKLRTDINKEQEALNKTQTELRQQTQALEQVENASEEAGDSFDDLSESAQNSTGGFTVMKGALANLVSDGINKAISAAKEFSKTMITNAAAVNAENSTYAQTFGDLVSQADAAVDRVASATGILRDRLTGTGASIYAFARSSGATTEEAMQLMENGLMAAADSAAYYDRSLEDSAETLKKFLKGNFANDAALGLSATEFTRNAKATELFKKEYKDLTEVQKQQTLLKMVTDSQKAAGAMGQAAREADGWENIQGNLNEAWRQFSASAGQAALQELTPIIKNITKEVGNGEGALSKASKTINKLSKTIIPPAGKAIKFLLENMETIGKVTFTAVTAFTALNAAMKISTAITKANTAVKALTAGVGLATKAQTIWNAVMAANPIGAMVTAVGLLAAGIYLLRQRQNEATESTSRLTEAQQQIIEKNQAVTQSWKEHKEAADEVAAGNIANVDYVATNLLPQLENLIDSNGKVKEGYEGRAQFILNELNQALGTEYSSLQQIIDQNGKVKQSILDVIEAKKGQFLLEAYEETYKEAIKNVAGAELERATQAQGLIGTEQALKDAALERDKARAEVEKAVQTGVSDTTMIEVLKRSTEAEKNYNKEKEVLDKKKAAYDKSKEDVMNYYNTISTYEAASTEMANGNTGKVIELLSSYGTGFQTATSTMQLEKDKQVEVLKQQVIDTEINLGLMEADYKKSQANMTEAERNEALLRIENARKQADQAKEEYYKVGGNMVKGMAEGASDSSWILEDAMRRIIAEAIAAAEDEADIESPSKVMKKRVGINLGRGIAVGVTDSTKDVIKSVKEQMSQIIDAYDMSAISNILTPTLTPVLNTPKNNTVQPANDMNGKNITIYQNNTFSQAHSRYELYKAKQETMSAVRLAVQGG